MAPILLRSSKIVQLWERQMVSPMRRSAALSVVADNCGANAPAAAGASVSERIRRLQAEARLLAQEQIQALEDALLQIERLSSEIAEGGEVYPVGVREIARRIAEDCEARGNTIQILAGRR